MDGNDELQDTQLTTIATNKMKIIMSKNVHDKASINCSETIDPSEVINTHALNVIDNECDSNDATNDSNGCGDGNGNSVAIATDDSNITAIPTEDNIGGSNDIDHALDTDDTDDTEIEFVVKEAIQHVRFNRQPTVRSCVETSGLCSIM